MNASRFPGFAFAGAIQLVRSWLLDLLPQSLPSQLNRHVLALASVLLHASAVEAKVTVSVEAGSVLRRGIPITFTPPGLGPWELVSDRGIHLPVQVDATGAAWFFMTDVLEAGASATFELLRPRLPSSAPHWVHATLQPGHVRVDVRGREAFTYRTLPTELPQGRPDLTPIFRRGGYLHPVLTPNGRVVTDDYPANHKHHHGIWFAWTRVDFEGRKTDFWNMGDGKGTVEFVDLDRVWGGPVHGGFQSRHRQVDLTSGTRRVAMDETWTVRAFDLGDDARVRLLDLVVTNTCASDVPVGLPKYRYGGIGVRGHARWNDSSQMGFLNSEGRTDRSKGDNAETLGNWAVMHGPLTDGMPGGIAIMGHPGNARSPQPQRIHPTEPFLCLAPQQAGDLKLSPGRPLVSRYRFVTFDGAPDPLLLKRLWLDYSDPPRVTVTTKR